MPEPPPEELLLRVPATGEVEPTVPRWRQGEIKGKTKTVWLGLTFCILAIAVFALLAAGTAAIWIPVGIFAILCIGFPFVLHDASRGAHWDEVGVTFTRAGKATHRILWSQDFMVTNAGSQIVLNGQQYRVKFPSATPIDQAWFMAAVLQHCWFTEPRPTNRKRGWGEVPAPETWLSTACALGCKDSWENTNGIGVFVNRPDRTSLAWLPALFAVGNPIAMFMSNVTHAHMAGFVIGAMIVAVFAVWLGQRGRPKQYGALVFQESDTYEVADDGLHVWRDGQRSGPLQYPREVSATRGRWLPAGKVTAWSDGEEMYLIDPKRLVALPADTPSRIIFAATNGAGRVGGRASKRTEPLAERVD